VSRRRVTTPRAGSRGCKRVFWSGKLFGAISSSAVGKRVIGTSAVGAARGLVGARKAFFGDFRPGWPTHQACAVQRIGGSPPGSRAGPCRFEQSRLIRARSRRRALAQQGDKAGSGQSAPAARCRSGQPSRDLQCSCRPRPGGAFPSDALDVVGFRSCPPRQWGDGRLGKRAVGRAGGFRGSSPLLRNAPPSAAV